MGWIGAIESVLYHIVQICIVLMELLGVIVLVSTALFCFFRWMKRDKHITLRPAQGIALALEFLLGGEVLRTIIARSWTELGILGAIILLRGLLTLLLRWETRGERSGSAAEQGN